MSTPIDTVRRHVRPDDTVYLLDRHKKDPWWRHVLGARSGGRAADGQQFTGALAASFFLVANPHEAAIVEVADHNLLDRITLPSWRPSMVEGFRRVTVEGYEYRRLQQVC